MLIVAVAFWLYQLQRGFRIRPNHSRTCRVWSSNRPPASASCVTCLSEKVAGEKPASFEALYDKATKAREEAERKLGRSAHDQRNAGQREQRAEDARRTN